MEGGVAVRWGGAWGDASRSKGEPGVDREWRRRVESEHDSKSPRPLSLVEPFIRSSEVGSTRVVVRCASPRPKITHIFADSHNNLITHCDLPLTVDGFTNASE